MSEAELMPPPTREELERLLRTFQSWLEWSMPFDESNAQMRLRRELERVLGSPTPGAEALDIAEEKGRREERARIRQIVLDRATRYAPDREAKALAILAEDLVYLEG